MKKTFSPLPLRPTEAAIYCRATGRDTIGCHCIILREKCTLSGNLFYYFFTLESDDSTQYVVIDKSLHPIDRYAAEQIIPESTFDLSAYLFPVRIMQSAYTGIKARIGDPAKFLIMNLLLALLTFCIRRRKKFRSGTTHRYTHCRTIRHLRHGGSIRHTLPPQRIKKKNIRYDTHTNKTSSL